MPSCVAPAHMPADAVTSGIKLSSDPSHLFQAPQQQLAPVCNSPPLQLQLALSLAAAGAQAAAGAAAAAALAGGYNLNIALQTEGGALAGGCIHDSHLLKGGRVMWVGG